VSHPVDALSTEAGDNERRNRTVSLSRGLKMRH